MNSQVQPYPPSPKKEITTPSLSPIPLARPPGTPVASATDLPRTQGPTTSRPPVPPPTIGAARPTLYSRNHSHGLSVVPSRVTTKRKSVVEGVGATKRQKTTGGRAVLLKSVLPLEEEEEEDTGSLTEAIQEFKKEIDSFVNPLPVPFLVVQDGVECDIGLALEALGEYVEGQFREMQSRTLNLAEKIDAKFATMAARAPDSELKARRKVAKLDRTAEDDQAYTFIKTMVHAVIRGAVDWKSSESPVTLLERGVVHQDEEGDNSEVDVPDWDERIDSVINKPWVERMTMRVAGCIEEEIAADTRTAKLLQNLDVNDMSREHVKDYFRHLKSNRKKGPERVKKEKRRQRRIARARDASKQATRTLAMLNYRLELAASALGVDIVPTDIILKASQFPMEVFSDEESGPEDVEDDVARTFASYGVPYQLPVGSFILRRPKPYLSTSMKKLTAFVRTLYKSLHGKLSASQRRITGPESTNLPMELHLEEWMIDPKWEPPEDRVKLVKFPSTITDEKRFEEIIDYAMKSWAEEQHVWDGRS